MKFYALLAFRNVRRHWRQSLAAIISIGAGFVALVIFQGYMEDALWQVWNEYRLRMMFGDVIIEKTGLHSPPGRHEPWKYSLDQSEQKYIESYLTAQRDEVVEWMPFLRLAGMITNGKISTMFWGLGYDLKKGPSFREKDWETNTLYGIPLDFSKSTQGIVLGQTLASYLDCLPDPKLKVIHTKAGYPPGIRKFRCLRPDLQVSSTTFDGQINALSLDVVGIVDAGFKDLDARHISMALENAQKLYNTEKISYVSIKLRDPDKVKEFAKYFQATADKDGQSLVIQDWRDHPLIGDMYQRVTSLLTLFRNFVVIVILTISSLSVLNTMVKIVKERSKEVGTLRSIGFTPGQICLSFVFEALFLGLLGSAMGSAISILATFAVNSAGLIYRAGMFVEPVPFNISLSWKWYLVSFLMLSILNISAAAFAAHGTLKRKISENLG